MKDIDFTDEQQEILIESLESYLNDLRTEVGGTDARDFRSHLKHREEILRQILGSLREGGETRTGRVKEYEMA